MTVLLESVDVRPASVEPVAWAWRSGPHTALEHYFEVLSEEALDVAAVFGPILAPFRGCDFQPGRVPEQYVVRHDPDGRLPLTIFHEGKRLASGRHAQDLVRMFTWHINRSTITKTVERSVLLHSSAAVRGGVTVILPADQESGKTTTIAGLLREGYDYVTDEAVSIDAETGWVTPFPKNLSVDTGSQHLFPECAPASIAPGDWQWQVPPHRLGARALHRPVPPPGIVVFPKYVKGATTRLVPVSPGEAVREMAQMTFEFRSHARRNLTTLAQVARRATAARLVIGSLDEAVAAVETLVSERLLEEL